MSEKVRVIDAKGRSKFVSKVVADNARAMKNAGLTVMEIPKFFEPTECDPNEGFEDTICDADGNENTSLPIKETEEKRPYNKTKKRK